MLAAMSSLLACGPSKRGDDGTGGDDQGSGSDPTQCTSGCATLSGKVYAPHWAPGDVPAGQEIPIFGAIVYVTDTRPAPIPDHTYCEQCVDTPQGSVSSGYDGGFNLTVQPGHYFLVIAKGQFRSEQEIDVVEGQNALQPAVTTLPSSMDPANGQWIPRIAIAKGNYDAVEDILGKIGFGAMSGDKLGTGVGENSFNEITFYNWDDSGATSVSTLLGSVAEMEKYHIIFFPCSTLVDDTLLQDPNVLKNIRQFVKDGGKLYVTDWSGELADRAFPSQLELGESDLGFGEAIDTAGTYDPDTLDANITTWGTSDGDLYTANDGKAFDNDLASWLGLQIGPSQDDPTPHQYDPNQFTVEDNWNYIAKMSSVMKGVDDMGMPVYDDPKPWLTGSDGTHGQKPLAVTYEPTGCGKVLFSTFQTSGADASESHAGLMPQERVLLFLIMEITACTQNPVIE